MFLVSHQTGTEQKQVMTVQYYIPIYKRTKGTHHEIVLFESSGQPESRRCPRHILFIFLLVLFSLYHTLVNINRLTVFIVKEFHIVNTLCACEL